MARCPSAREHRRAAPHAAHGRIDLVAVFKALVAEPVPAVDEHFVSALEQRLLARFGHRPAVPPVNPRPSSVQCGPEPAAPQRVASVV